MLALRGVLALRDVLACGACAWCSVPWCRDTSRWAARACAAEYICESPAAAGLGLSFLGAAGSESRAKAAV